MSQDPLLEIEGVAKLYGWYVEEKPAHGGERKFEVLPGDPKRPLDTLYITVFPDYTGWGIGIGTPERIRMRGSVLMRTTLLRIFKDVFDAKQISQ